MQKLIFSNSVADELSAIVAAFAPNKVYILTDTNTRAIALYTRMGWQLDGSTSLEFDPKQYPTVTRKCALVQMRYAGPAQE